MDALGGLGLEAPHSLGDVRRFSHEAMATVFEVHVLHPDAAYAGQGAQAAFDLVDRLERELSRFIPNSDISRINHLTDGDATAVTASTMECLLIARHLFEITGGTFDISIGTGLPSLELDPDARTVRAAAAGVRLDLGAIGKGYAVDLMAEVLEEWELATSLVHGGFSSVLALDAPAGHGGWPLTLSNPVGDGGVLEHLSMRQTALSASGLRRGDHIVDPRTGRPVHGRVGAWAALPRPRSSPAGDGPRLAPAAVADALTTAFMMLGADEIAELCDRSPGLRAWILDAGESDRETTLRHFGGE